jgi:hypothetical protein
MRPGTLPAQLPRALISRKLAFERQISAYDSEDDGELAEVFTEPNNSTPFLGSILHRIGIRFG